MLAVPSNLLGRIKGGNPWHHALAIFLLCLMVLLSIRAADEYRWSDWGFGDAQTMLSLRQWEEGGWIANYFLFKPQGYAPVIDQLDDPELRHHAHGTCPGSSPRVGPRLWYTHYPAGYLIPYALLFRMGLDSLFSVRMLSILLSIGGLALMYAVFNLVTSPRVAFLAVLFYGLSGSFLGYADSLANQPIDDLLRFGFMLAVVLSTRSGKEAAKQRWMIAAWVIELALSLASFDSVFFVYLWLIGWDLLEKRGFRWKVYLLYALAPVTAHGLQFLQNVWYLGWHDAFIDITDAFLLKHGADTGYNFGMGRLGTIIVSLSIVFESLFAPSWLLLVLLAVYLIYIRFLAGDRRDLPTAGLLGVLFLCGLSFVLILPHAARMPYEARQMVPVIALLVSGTTWSFLDLFRESLHGGGGRQTAAGGKTGSGGTVSYLLATAILLVVFWSGYAMSDRSSTYDMARLMPEIRFAAQLRTMPTEHDPVFYDLGGFSTFWDPTYVPGYPQIMPITEYYAGSRPILCFKGPEEAAADVAVMVRKSSKPFSPVLVADDRDRLRRTLVVLKEQNVISSIPPSFFNVMGRFVVDLTDFIVWGSHDTDRHS
jgi:hypothetical protein